MEPKNDIKIEPSKSLTAALWFIVVFLGVDVMAAYLSLLPDPFPAYSAMIFDMLGNILAFVVVGGFFLACICAFLFVIGSLIFPLRY